MGVGVVAGELGGSGVPTHIWNAGLASEGMSRENVVRSVFRVKEE
jgi:hypothetical protein